MPDTEVIDVSRSLPPRRAARRKFTHVALPSQERIFSCLAAVRNSLAPAPTRWQRPGRVQRGRVVCGPFASAPVLQSRPSATETIGITVLARGTASDGKGTFAETGLSHTGVGTYTLAAGNLAPSWQHCARSCLRRCQPCEGRLHQRQSGHWRHAGQRAGRRSNAGPSVRGGHGRGCGCWPGGHRNRDGRGGHWRRGERHRDRRGRTLRGVGRGKRYAGGLAEPGLYRHARAGPAGRDGHDRVLPGV